MILSIIFILMLLSGISLLVAVVGNSILRKHARKAVGRGKFTFNSNAYRAQLKQEYEKRVEQVRAQTPGLPEKGYIPGEPKPMVFPEREKVAAGGKWFLIFLVAVVIVVFGSLLGIKAYKNYIEHPRVYFCESIDYVNMKPIGKSDTFIRGKVTVLLKSHNSFNVNNIKVEVYRIDQQGFHTYLQKEIPLKPEWGSISFQILFDRLGTYRLFFYDELESLIAKKDITIVPDSYVFKPVPAE